MRIPARSAAVLGGAVLLIATSASTASADPRSAPPPESGCPSGALVIDPETFAYLYNLGYRAPTAADLNGNQRVCAIPFDEHAAAQLCPQCVAGYYLFFDDTYPGRH